MFLKKLTLAGAAILMSGSAMAACNIDGRVSIVGNEFPAIHAVADGAKACSGGEVKANLTADHQKINVAGMTGNPAMNLIKGHAKAGVFSAEHTAIKKLKIDDGDVTLGFRAEDAEVVSSKGDITAPIYSIELLGDATMVTVRIGEALISVKADKSYRAEIGDTVHIHVPVDHCHLFDAQSGERIGS